MKKLLVTITACYFFLPVTNAQLWKVRRLELTAGIPNEALASRDRGMTNGSTEVLPLGLGLNMIYSDRINLGVELGGRFTNSDLIDGFSGLNSRTDVYHLLNFSITYKIRTENCVAVVR